MKATKYRQVCKPALTQREVTDLLNLLQQKIGSVNEDAASTTDQGLKFQLAVCRAEYAELWDKVHASRFA